MKPQPAIPRQVIRRNASPALCAALFAALGALLPGCAALTNPVANGIPVRLLPEELHAQTNEGLERTPLTLLRQPPPEVYRLAAGDTLGVYIDGVLGSSETPPPVNVPVSAEMPPSIGYPIPVRADGTISLPLVGPLRVEGMTIEEAEELVVEAYTTTREEGADEGILRSGTQILISLMRPRHVRVMVIREDSQQQQLSLRNESLLGLGTTETTIGGNRGNSGVGEVLELPAYENDVLNALARTGGLPGLESTQEVVIQRGYWDQNADPSGAIASMPGATAMYAGDEPHRITRIPMRLRPGQPLGFTPRDVILNNGDIVTVRGREPQFFYTGGLLPAGEFPLPTDYDLTVLEAVLKARGPLFNGGLNTSNFNGAVIAVGLGNPSPNLLSVLRRTPGGGQVNIRVDLDEAARDPRQNLLVQAGDVLILQETPDQAVTRYMSTIFRLDVFTRFLNRGDATGTVSVAAP